jgi:pyruvate kinase
MLSAESAAGKYPVESIAMMNKIIIETETQMMLEPRPSIMATGKRRSLTVPETICECMAHSAQDLDLAAIAIFTESGNTARLLSKYRPESPIYALSPFEHVVHRSMLLWGTFPIQCERFVSTDSLVNTAEEILESRGFVKPREVVGIVAGTATKTGATNFMRLHLIGDR